MNFQLVIQFAANTGEEFEDLLKLTDSVTNTLAGEPKTVVDGHDYGLGEFNILIHTDDPEVVFAKTADFIDRQHPGIPLAAGYRDFDEDTYTVLWPEGAERIAVS
jgi:hypothetical protein